MGERWVGGNRKAAEPTRLIQFEPRAAIMVGEEDVGVSVEREEWQAAQNERQVEAEGEHAWFEPARKNKSGCHAKHTRIIAEPLSYLNFRINRLLSSERDPRNPRR